MSNKKLVILSGAVLLSGFFISGSALAASRNFEGMKNGMARKNFHGAMPAVTGIVSTINGTSFSVSGRNGTSYAVDAANATVFKNNATSTVSSIAVGDMVSVQGTLNGTNVAATKIRDMVRSGEKENDGIQIQGNGQPVVAGKVSSVNGSTFVIANSSNVSYTIDATSAKIQKAGNASSTISNIAVGDNVIVQGTVNGTSVLAASVIDRTNANANTKANNNGHARMNFFGSIGSFFKHLFGF